ncbi:putative Tripeptidyl-peptidase sed1 [Microdochium trichocladiopsis]|uniref:Tripeptidyl-peptidase sed1 n=1 Tax=Microdochium trichocladiopsis TaxID=1682393 RepID=A0A9P8XV93_9PEZI|nr:putative Tripeptidyl-peptidase sed1 [Microdochium trichocladiopsis]KAH7017961.1 putative Tripeptidyl-peptidase sed1 [Microdochium trichocladiopsis]
MRFHVIQLALLGGIALEAAAKPVVPTTHTLHERAGQHWGRDWRVKQRLPRNAKLPMRIGLQQSNEAVGRDRLEDISNPKSPNYGKHMTAEEVRQLFAPARETVETVVEWLTDSGIHIDRISQSYNKQWIQVDLSADEAESLLLTEYHLYEHSASGAHDIATRDYHVPRHIAQHIDYITPGVRLRADPKKTELAKRRSNLHKRTIAMHKAEKLLPALPQLNASTCATYITNDCLSTQYHIPPGNKASPGNELGIFETLNDHYSKKDLDEFFAALYPRVPQGTYPEERLVDGALGAVETPGDPTLEVGLESNLDFQSAWPIIWPQKTVLFQVDDQPVEIAEANPLPYLGFYNTFYDALDGSYCSYAAFGETGNCVRPECLDPSYPNPAEGGYKGELMCGVYKPTNVISISYGGGEADVPASYWKRQCSEIMKLSLQGVTVVQSSGDSGVASYPGDFGLPTGCTGPAGTVFYPAYMCPYVLSVGGTQLDSRSNSTTNKPGCKLYERAVTRFPSGGGFSDYFDVPDYQKDAVQTYFDTTPLPFVGYTTRDPAKNFTDVAPGVFKIGGRGYPDVASVGDRFVVRSNSTWNTIGGTSLSAPIWAGIITRINEERLAKGKSTVGFVHPTIYAHPEVFTDITEGSNPGCKSGGFPAAKGWDPVTGLGSPKYDQLLKVFMSLP